MLSKHRSTQKSFTERYFFLKKNKKRVVGAERPFVIPQQREVETIYFYIEKCFNCG